MNFYYGNQGASPPPTLLSPRIIIFWIQRISSARIITRGMFIRVSFKSADNCIYGIRMHCRICGMTCINSLEQRHCFFSPDFPDNNNIRGAGVTPAAKVHTCLYRIHYLFFVKDSRVTLPIQFMWCSMSSCVSSMLTILATGGMKSETEFNEEVFHGGSLPRQNIMLLPFSNHKPKISQNIWGISPVLDKIDRRKGMFLGISW